MTADQLEVLKSAIREIIMLDGKDARVDELAEAISTLIDVKVAVALDSMPKKNWPTSMANA